MRLPVTLKSPKGLLPGAALLLILVALGWTALWGVQLQMAHTITGEPPRDMTSFWLTLATLTVSLLMVVFWGSRLARLRAADVVCTKRRPLLDSPAQRAALKHLMRIEARL
ncbi:MAG: hypothetical protein H6839_12650 [Planctomycetes bacterium]|nr:hypothetical protein [Planctomycetota bacterium]